MRYTFVERGIVPAVIRENLMAKLDILIIGLVLNQDLIGIIAVIFIGREARS